jgi:hypothetical protein
MVRLLDAFLFKSSISVLAFFIFLQSFSYETFAYSPPSKIVEDLREDWLFYHPNYKSFVPYINGTPFKSMNAGFIINSKLYKGKEIMCCVQPGTSLFIEQKIVAHYKQEQCVKFGIDSLSKVFGKDSLFITIYNPDFSSARQFSYIVNPDKKSKEDFIETQSIFSVIPRLKPDFNNFFAFGWVLILGFYGMLNRFYPKSIKEYFDVAKAFAIKTREEQIYKLRLLGRVNLLMMIAQSILFSFLVLVVLHTSGNYPKSLDLLQIGDFSATMGVWMLLSAVIFMVYLSKYYMVGMMSGIFYLRDFKSVHFFDFLRITILFTCLIFAIVSVFHLTMNGLGETTYHVLLYMVIFFIIIRGLWIYFKLAKASSFRNVHLFCYLCTTEIIPILIGLKIFVF